MTFVYQTSFNSTLYLFAESDFLLGHITDRTNTGNNGNYESSNPQKNKTLLQVLKFPLILLSVSEPIP